MKQKRIKVTFVLMALLLLLSASACGSSKPCDGCGRTLTKAYTNTSTGEKDYYCKSCSSDCAFCRKDATKHYTSGLGRVLFVCDDCYDYIHGINN